ncbi:DUF5667 domain-containing protein [Chloroflexota bacterium]
MKSFENILSICIEDIKAGRSTLERCLAQYPSIRGQLEPLLKIALSIQEPPPFQPTSDFKIRAKVQLMDYIHDSNKAKKSWTIFPNLGIREMWHLNWLRTTAIIVAIMLTFSALGAGTVNASKDSLPGEALYSVKIATEHVRSLLTFNDIAQIELELAFADTRLQEMGALVNKNVKSLAVAVEGYERNITNAISKVESVSSTGIASNKLEAIALAVLQHASVFDEINDSVVSTGKETVRQALEFAFTAQHRVLRSLAEEDPLRATEINIISMQNRLNRANNSANEGEIMEAEHALIQFKEMLKFSEELTKITREFGHSTTAISASNLSAATTQLEIISNMQGKVSSEIIDTVKECVGESLEYHKKESEGPSGNGNNAPAEPGNAPEEPGNAPEEPGNAPSDPGNIPDDPGNIPDEPGNTPDEPGNIPDEPGNTPDEPGNIPDEPGNTPDEPGNIPDEPGNTPDEPGNIPDEPGNMPEEPGKDSVQYKVLVFTNHIAPHIATIPEFAAYYS